MSDSRYSPNISKKDSTTVQIFREVTLKVRVISKKLVAGKKTKIQGEAFIFTSTISRAGLNLPKSRGINADLQSPRTKLLYFIYTAPNSKIKATPGVKSNISSALGYKSDGHFHYDWNYLISAGMIEEKQGQFLVTDTGKKEFALQSTAAMNNWIIVVMGIAMVVFTVGIDLEFLPKESIAFFGAALILIGSLFLIISRKTKPKLPPEAKALAKELNRH
jgi:hypothetical protein